MTEERRRFTRIAYAAPAALVLASHRAPVAVIDLSLKGALLRVPAGAALPGIGTPCELRLALGGDASAIRMPARVAHHDGRELGLECSELDLDSATHLRRLIGLNLHDPALLDRDLMALIGAQAGASEAWATHLATGSFTVKMTPQADTGATDGNTSLGRMSLDKVFSGDLSGTGHGEMLTALTATTGSAVYVAVERVNGTLHGRAGSFVFHHRGTMDRGQQDLSIQVVPDSGTGALAGIAGSFALTVVDGQHRYEFSYVLPVPAGAAA